MSIVYIQVVCATSSLAMGVNLPARLVVLKGTRRYADAIPGTTQEAGYQDYEQSVCLQMMGRAGRPQYDTEGVAVIMTERQVLCVLRMFFFACKHDAPVPPTIPNTSTACAQV